MNRKSANAPGTEEATRLKAQADRVLIVRDDWGIAHVHGKSDADAVFGMIYAQAEDDFNRVETNYLVALGRAAEADGEAAIWSDLRQRLFVDPVDLKAKYTASPAYLKALMDAWADGLNYYLATHPRTRPKVIRRFEPWMALSFTEGANGGDIAKISLADMAAFYEAPEAQHLAAAEAAAARFEEPTGSNGIAIAPAATRDGHALLLINPHTAFYLRSELQMTSDEGLNAYGAVTWGQFFVYQGFNDHAGWMHTTSTADCVDEFAETIVRRASRLFYRYGDQLRPVRRSTVTIRYSTPEGGLAARVFVVRRTHHGPIVRAADGRWIAVSLMNRPVEALEQSFLRTKACDLAAFTEVSARAANSTNNTLFADDRGEIALFAPQFVPLRDDRFDYTQPVDGSDPAADWREPTPFAELPSVVTPPNGWVYNANDGPWWAAGLHSPRRQDFPRYMDQVGANPRTAHALEVLQSRRDFTLQGLIDAAYDPHLPIFETLLPDLVAAYDALSAGDPARDDLAAPIAVLRDWNCRWSVQSVATTLAVSWGENLQASLAADVRAGSLAVVERIRCATPVQMLTALTECIDVLANDFGDWRVPWGGLNRFQRLDGAIEPRFDDAAASWPTPWTSSQWGSLAAYGAKRYPGAKLLYGSTGNSFVAVVEFGPRVRALAVSAGGASGDPDSPHFADQSELFANGGLRPVYFYPDELIGHIERTYRPGQQAGGADALTITLSDRV
jgi:acyl-homoserine-lactone acylase